MNCSSPIGKLIAGLRYLIARRGPLALSVNQFGGFVRADPRGSRPDVQLYFNPVTYGAGDATRTRIDVDRFSGFYSLLSADAADEPRAHRHRERGLSRPAAHRTELSGDRERLADVVARRTAHQRIARTKAMRSLIREAIPPPDLDAMDDEAILAPTSARAPHRLSPGRHLPNGAATGRCGRRSGLARARHRSPARRRRIGLPDGDVREYQCADRDGRAKGRGPDYERIKP